jgi:hypothetical protein
MRVRQTRRRGRRRDHQHPRPAPPQALKASPACTLSISAGHQLLRWIYGSPLRGSHHRRSGLYPLDIPSELRGPPPAARRPGPPLRPRAHHLGSGTATLPTAAGRTSWGAAKMSTKSAMS